MGSASIWGFLHILLFVFWLGAEIGVFVSTYLLRDARRTIEQRNTLLRVAGIIHVLPRVCFALILPVGVELTRQVGVYPLTPGLQSGAWLVSAVWLLLIVLHMRFGRAPLGALLRLANIFLMAVAGLSFVVYGLNSLATGAPIDETWFATKLFLVGLVFWTAITVDVSFKPFYAPFSETERIGPTPEREEAMRRAALHSLIAMGVLYMLLIAIAFIGKLKPF